MDFELLLLTTMQSSVSRFIRMLHSGCRSVPTTWPIRYGCTCLLGWTRITPCCYPKLRLRLCHSGIIHTQKCYNTGCSLQCSCDQLNNFLDKYSQLCPWQFKSVTTPHRRVTVTLFRCLTSHYRFYHHIRHCPMSLLKYESLISRTEHALTG